MTKVSDQMFQEFRGNLSETLSISNQLDAPAGQLRSNTYHERRILQYRLEMLLRQLELIDRAITQEAR